MRTSRGQKRIPFVLVVAERPGRKHGVEVADKSGAETNTRAKPLRGGGGSFMQAFRGHRTAGKHRKPL